MDRPTKSLKCLQNGFDSNIMQFQEATNIAEDIGLKEKKNQRTCDTADSPIIVSISSMWSKTISGTTFAMLDNSENTWLRVTASFAQRAH